MRHALGPWQLERPRKPLYEHRAHTQTESNPYTRVYSRYAILSVCYTLCMLYSRDTILSGYYTLGILYSLYAILSGYYSSILSVYYTVAERPNGLSVVSPPPKLNTNTTVNCSHTQVGLGVFDACLLVTSLVLVVRIFLLRPRTVQWT